MSREIKIEEKTVSSGIKAFKFSKQDRLSYLVDSKSLIDAGVPFEGEADYLILTHCHFDHIVYALEIKERTGCEIIASRKCKEHLKRMDEVVLKEEFKHWLEEEYHKIKPFEVDRVVEEGDLVGNLKVIETPGHTDGGISLFEGERRILFAGDTWFANGVGRTDLPSSSSKKLRESLKKLKDHDPVIVFPGHGENFRRGDDT